MRRQTINTDILKEMTITTKQNSCGIVGAIVIKKYEDF